MLLTPPNISDLRRDYRANALSKQQVSPNPFLQFDNWLQQALSSELIEPTAMFVATVNAEGAPSLRTVLLKEHSNAGFVFFTNYLSRKGCQIAENNHVALLFYWDVLERQVRIEGSAELIPPDQSDAYFQSRPKSSCIGALASPQSQVIASREELESHVNQLNQQYADTDIIERPTYWGGYLVRPTLFEFWQGRTSRLHDRIQYRLLPNQTWCIERLAP